MPAATSPSALITVLRLMPDAVATAVLPPRPNISDVAPATTRRCSSFMWGKTTSKNRASASDVTSTPTRYYARTNLSWILNANFHSNDRDGLVLPAPFIWPQEDAFRQSSMMAVLRPFIDAIGLS
jgi:hypothetical protein